MDNDTAAEILRKLHVRNPKKAIKAVKKMGEAYAAAIFLELYKSDDDQEIIRAIVSNNTLNYSITKEVLKNESVSVDEAVKIF